MMRTLHVIIFGDEKGISQVDLMKLNSVGFEMLFSGVEGGIELILQKRPDIVFINKSTKIIDSIGLCNKIHTLFHIPVIIISDRADEIDCILGLEIGADDYITRPFSMDEFILRIKNILWRYQKKKFNNECQFFKSSSSS
ncbi:TPA: response regulator [Klebsiella variicola subsp. variicola]